MPLPVAIEGPWPMMPVPVQNTQMCTWFWSQLLQGLIQSRPTKNRGRTYMLSISWAPWHYLWRILRPGTAAANFQKLTAKYFYTVLYALYGNNHKRTPTYCSHIQWIVDSCQSCCGFFFSFPQCFARQKLFEQNHQARQTAWEVLVLIAFDPAYGKNHRFVESNKASKAVFAHLLLTR